MRRQRTGLTWIVLSWFALVLVGCSQVGTDAQPDTASAPAILTQPADQDVAEGQTATFAVVATGSQPLAYQWSRERRRDQRRGHGELQRRRQCG